jgi:hypothetical protein
MRLALTLVGVLTTGGWAVGAHQGVLPVPAQMLQAVTALGGDPAQLKNIQLNPIQTTYNNVMRQITSGTSAPPAGFQGTPVIIQPNSFPTVTQPNMTINGGMPNGFSSNVEAQIRLNNNRMQDMANYAKNPAGWHGPPPH